MSNGESGFRVGKYAYPSNSMFGGRSSWRTAPEWEPSQKDKERKYRSRDQHVARHNMGGYRIGFATDTLTHVGMQAFLGSGLLP